MKTLAYHNKNINLRPKATRYLDAILLFACLFVVFLDP